MSGQIDKEFFQSWSHEMAYVLGFFVADGSMYETRRGTKYFDFTSTDKVLIERIKSTLDSDHKISSRTGSGDRQDSYRLQIGSKDMFADLKELGMKQRKTKDLELPGMPERYFGSFVRGYFDGDGSVWVGTIHASRDVNSCGISSRFVSSSKQFLEGLREELSKQAGMGAGSLSEAKRSFCLQYSIKDSLLLAELMYDNLSSDLCLKEKRRKFAEFKNQRTE